MSENPIAVVDGTKRGVTMVTVRTSARNLDLDGSFVAVDDEVDGKSYSCLYRMGPRDVENPYHENREWGMIIAARGEIAHMSGAVDVHRAELELISVIDDQDRVVGMPKPHATGTPVRSLHSDELSRHNQEKKHFAIIGSVAHNDAIPFSVQARHFGEWDSGGFGEAKHGVYAGRNGSGKTVIASSIIALMLAHNPQLGLLLPDTAGDLSQRGKHNRSAFRYDWMDLVERKGGRLTFVDLEELRCEREQVLAKLLEPFFRNEFSFGQDKPQEMAKKISEELLTDKGVVDVARLDAASVLQFSLTHIASVYAVVATCNQKRAVIQACMGDQNRMAKLSKRFDHDIKRFFIGSRSISKIIDDVLDNGARIILRLAAGQDQEKDVIMLELFRGLKTKAERNYKAYGRSSNAIVLLDEGPRWVKQGAEDDISKTIIDAYNTTRKYGLGWHIVTQRLVAIDKNVLAQAHTKWVGRGMGTAGDNQHLEDIFGKDGVAEYKRLETRGGYFFLAAGDQINFGSGNQRVAVRTFDGDCTQRLIDANPHIFTDEVMQRSLKRHRQLGFLQKVFFKKLTPKMNR